MPQSETKTCQNCQKEFVIEPEDFEFYEKVKVPAPTWCPECRLQRRLIFRNEHNLYKRKDSRTGKMIFSTIPEEASVKVHERDYWWSDEWNPMEYGKDYDFNKPFFEQFKELTRQVPWFSRSVINNINSDYCANAGYLKNCYLVFNTTEAEDCAYGVFLNHSKDSFDNYQLMSSELCHQCFMVEKSYQAFFSSHCHGCQNVYFSKNLANCQNCFACINLRNKKYHIFNQPYPKEEYFKKLKEIDISSFANFLETEKKARDFWLKSPNKFMQGIKNVNVSGDYISHSKNVFDSFMVHDAEDCRYCFNILSATKDCYDYSIWGINSELVYESTQVGYNPYNIKFSIFCYPDCHDLEYCLMCHSSSNLFGCMGLKKKQYCIFNKQYTKEEYEEIVPRIKEHMNKTPYTDERGRVYKYGEFFPPEFSPLPCNVTITQEYFPLTKKQATAQKYHWKDPEERGTEPDIHYKDLPDHIKDVKDEEVIGKTILCQDWDKDETKASEHNCTKVFKIIPQELEFYRKFNLPLPRRCPQCRHFHRIQQRNPIKLYKRKCMKQGCSNEFMTTYSPERPEIVYCEKCYQREVA